MISALMAEVAALRKTVAEKPENADFYESNLKAQWKRPSRSYNDMIELVHSADMGKN